MRPRRLTVVERRRVKRRTPPLCPLFQVRLLADPRAVAVAMPAGAPPERRPRKRRGLTARCARSLDDRAAARACLALITIKANRSFVQVKEFFQLTWF